MKTLFLLPGIAVASLAIPYLFTEIKIEEPTPGSTASRISPSYEWTQMAPPGSGTHQHEWIQGTYPSAIVPLIAFNGDLCMVGQKRVWTSSDGITWRALDKDDWGERISTTTVSRISGARRMERTGRN